MNKRKDAVGQVARVPSLMIFFSLVLVMETLTITMPGAWAYYVFSGIVTDILILLIVWCAWRWPKENVAQA